MRKSTRHIFVFFHCIDAAWTFYHLLHRWCKDVIRITIVTMFAMSEFHFLFCENYNNRNIEDNSYVLVYFYVCVSLSLLSAMLFYVFIKNKTMVVQYLESRSVWKRNNNKNGTNIVVARGVGKADKNINANLNKPSDIYNNTSVAQHEKNKNNTCVYQMIATKNDPITGRRSQSDEILSFPSLKMNLKSVGGNESENSNDNNTSDRSAENEIQLYKNNSKNCKNRKWTPKYQYYNGVGGTHNSTLRRGNELISGKYNEPCPLIASNFTSTASNSNIVLNDGNDVN